MTEHLGINEQRARELIANSDVDKLREYAGAFLDELIEARQLIHDKLTNPLAPVNPSILWAAAVGALRRLAASPAGDHWEDDEKPALPRAADWLETIGPDTDKLPCEVCLKPTSRACSRCDRPLCTTHSVLNINSGRHFGGPLCQM
jgi:hypothetical protein